MGEPIGVLSFLRCGTGSFLGPLRPNEVGAKPFTDRAAVVRCRGTAGRIVEGMIGRRHAVRGMAHQVRHDRANAVLFVIEHDGCATGRAGAEFQGTIRVLIVEWLAVQAIGVIDGEITVSEKRDMGRVLSRNALADGAVTGVVVDRIVVRVSVYVVAPSRIRHVFLLGCAQQPRPR